MRSAGLWLGAMVAVVAMGFVALVNMGGGTASGSTVMKHTASGSESATESGSESATSSESTQKVWICHRLGNGGGYNLMEIEDTALETHLGHGDLYPDANGGCDFSSETSTATESASATVTATVIVPGPATTVNVGGTVTVTATPVATAVITPSPGIVSPTPTITPSPGVVSQSPTITPLPGTVPAGGGGEAPSGLPLWALLAIAASVITGIGASVQLSRRGAR